MHKRLKDIKQWQFKKKKKKSQLHSLSIFGCIYTLGIACPEQKPAEEPKLTALPHQLKSEAWKFPFVSSPIGVIDIPGAVFLGLEYQANSHFSL